MFLLAVLNDLRAIFALNGISNFSRDQSRLTIPVEHCVPSCF